jgi:hypothetical protein
MLISPYLVRIMIQNGKGIDVFCWYEARLSVNQQEANSKIQMTKFQNLSDLWRINFKFQNSMTKIFAKKNIVDVQLL